MKATTAITAKPTSVTTTAMVVSLVVSLPSSVAGLLDAHCWSESECEDIKGRQNTSGLGLNIIAMNIEGLDLNVLEVEGHGIFGGIARRNCPRTGVTIARERIKPQIRGNIARQIGLHSPRCVGKR